MPEEIVEYYEYDGKSLKTSATYFDDRSIATIVDVDGDIGELEIAVREHGMELADLEEFFPATGSAKNQGYTYNLRKIVRSIIYEAYRKEGTDLDVANVRNFWYTHLKHVITKILGLGESTSVLSTVNTAWGEMINSGLVSYEGLSIIGGKESSRMSIVKDSPFNNLIVAVEKVDYFDMFEWIPKLFNCTLVTAGGQPSRTVARAFIRELKDLDVDLDQTFSMCVASDLDPAGYYIQDAFRKQFESAIQYYGGTGSVEIKRLFVRKDQVTRELLESQAMPCQDKANSEKARKSEDTKWEHFCKEANGGLYMNLSQAGPGNWRTTEIDGEPKVRALLEMNVFPRKVIEKAILSELLKIIHDTNDESKIMIPEIMRIFELIREDAIEEVYEQVRKEIIQPMIEEFLSQTTSWKNYNWNIYRDGVLEAEKEKDEKIEEIDDEIDPKIWGLEEQAEERVPELYERVSEIEDEITRLKEELEEVNEDISEKCSDIFEEVENLKEEKRERKAPINDEYKKRKGVLQKQRTYRDEQVETFKDEKSGVFNPIEMALKADVKGVLGDENVDYRFRDIEEMDRFQGHISKLLIDPNELLEEGVSCFEQDIPTFQEDDLLVKASQRHDENVENVRKSFSNKFTSEMKTFIKEHADGVEFEVRGEIESVDFGDEIDQRKKEIEKEIEDGAWKDDDGEDEKGGDES